MAYEVIKAVRERTDKVLVTVRDTNWVLDAATGECQQVTVIHNPAAGAAVLQQKIKDAFGALESQAVDAILETEITAAVASMTTGEV